MFDISVRIVLLQLLLVFSEKNYKCDARIGVVARLGYNLMCYNM